MATLEGRGRLLICALEWWASEAGDDGRLVRQDAGAPRTASDVEDCVSLHPEEDEEQLVIKTRKKGKGQIVQSSS